MESAVFRTPEEIRKITYWIYFYGSIGMAVDIYGVKPDKILMLDIPANKCGSIAGIFGIISIYLLISFVSKGCLEYFSFQKKRDQELKDILSQTERPEDLFLLKSKDYRIHAMINKLNLDINRSDFFIKNLSIVSIAIEFALPFIYGVLSAYTLAKPSWLFLSSLLS